MIHPGDPGPSDWANAVDAALAALPATYATGGEVRSHVLTNGTDQTATLQAELNALTLSGAGGTLVLPSGTVTITGVLTLTNDGATPPKQAGVTLRGTGSHWSGRGTAPIGGTVLAFSGTDTYGLLKTNGLGSLRIDGVTFRNVGTTATPFIYTTNTTLHIAECSFYGSKTQAACDQDAIVCGGLTSVEGFAGWNDGFQGYGTNISNNFFSGIRRAVYGRTFFNANVIAGNTIWGTCGNAGGAAIDIDGDPAGTAGTSAYGNIVCDNLIELPWYKWGIRLGWAIQNVISHNAMFDAQTVNATAGVRVESVAAWNMVQEGYTDYTHAIPLDDQTAAKNTVFQSNSPEVYSVLGPAKFANANHDTLITRLKVCGPNPLLIQSDTAMGSGASTFQIKRSAAEVTNPGASVLFINTGGAFLFDSTAINAGNVTGPYASWTNNGRRWTSIGNLAGQEGGSPMLQDSGPNGSYFDLKNYAVRFYDDSGILRLRLAARKDGLDLGAASDATILRAAAGIVNLGKLAVTNSAAATTPGSVTKKIEVFDAAGASLGFIAVYSSIT